MKMNCSKELIFLFSLIVSIASLSHPAWAHRVNIFAWTEGDTVNVVSNFPSGKKVQSGHVVVMDMQGHELLSGTTNEEGEFSFKIPRREDIKIVRMAGEGHQAEWTLHASEMEEWNEAKTAPGRMTATEQGKTTMTASHPSWEDKAGPQYPRFDVKDIENALEPLLDRKLRPIKKMLIDAQQKGPGVRDIVAGLGYILGLVGIAAYVQSRKRRG